MAQPDGDCGQSLAKLDQTSQVLARYKCNPPHLHCIFHFETGHAMKRVGFAVEALCGDYICNALSTDSMEILWAEKKLA